MKQKLPFEPKELTILFEDGECTTLHQNKCIYDKKTGKLYCLVKDTLIIEED